MLSLGTKFIPKWNQHNGRKHFWNSMISRGNLSLGHFCRRKPGIFVQFREFRVQSYFIQPVEDKDINYFCWKVRDKIGNYIETSFNPSQNFKQRNGPLRKIITNKNKVICILLTIRIQILGATVYKVMLSMNAVCNYTREILLPNKQVFAVQHGRI